MKILYIVPSLKKKGPIEVLFNIVKHIKNDEIIILQIVDEKSAFKNKARFENIDNLKIVTLSNRGLKKDFFILGKKLKNYVDILQPDIIHSHCLLPDVLTAYFLTKERILSTCHNNPNYDYKLKANFLLAPLMIFFQKKAFKRFVSVISISGYIQDVMKGMGISSELVYNGVSTEIFKTIKNQEKLNELKLKYNLPVDKKIVLSLSSLIKRKNIEKLVSCFLKANNEDAILVLVGEGSQKKIISEMTSTDDNVYLLGHQQEVSEFLNISDLLVSISISEGFSLIIAEGNSIGLPMILSNIPPHVEQFDENQLEDGRIRFIDLLNDSCDQDLTSMIDKSLREFSGVKVNKLQDKFTSAFMANKYLDHYHKLINDRS